MKQFFLISFFVLFLHSAYAQEHVFFTGFFPEAAITKSLKNGDKVNFKVENQEIFFQNLPNREDRWKVSHYRTDLMAFYNWKLKSNTGLAFGVFHRIQDGPNANRIIQQVSFIQRLRNYRLAHRFRTDQTFEKNEDPVFRLRYRLALDIPLNGTTLDVGESYLVISNEPIFELQGEQFDIENRLVFTLGKLISEGQKFEYSLDYRTDGFFQDGFRTRLWFKLGYFLTI
ncbi:DUF2490 domain-containing protein [Algoriphagus namhaensis]